MSPGGTAIIGLFVLVVALSIMSCTHGFGPRCARAGYEGPALERCVMRMTAGAPLYEENIGYAP